MAARAEGSLHLLVTRLGFVFVNEGGGGTSLLLRVAVKSTLLTELRQVAPARVVIPGSLVGKRRTVLGDW